MTQVHKHTPGPWGIRQSASIFDNALLITASQNGGKTFGGHIVTNLCDPAKFENCKNFSPEEQLANARLIVASPNLLKAIMRCVTAIEAYAGVMTNEIAAELAQAKWEAQVA